MIIIESCIVDTEEWKPEGQLNIEAFSNDFINFALTQTCRLIAMERARDGQPLPVRRVLVRARVGDNVVLRVASESIEGDELSLLWTSGLWAEKLYGFKQANAPSYFVVADSEAKARYAVSQITAGWPDGYKLASSGHFASWSLDALRILAGAFRMLVSHEANRRPFPN